MRDRAPPLAQFARSLALEDRAEWDAWCNGGGRPANVPFCPDRAYRGGGWVSYAHWLGADGDPAQGTDAPSDGSGAGAAWPQQRAGAGGRGTLKAKTKTKATAKPRRAKPKHDAAQARGRGGQGGGGGGGGAPRDARGVEAAPQFYLPFAEAVNMVRPLKLAGMGAWWEFCKSSARPGNLPSMPNLTYKDAGWRGWDHWLGTPTPSSTPSPMPAATATAAAVAYGGVYSMHGAYGGHGAYGAPPVPTHPHGYLATHAQGHGHPHMYVGGRHSITASQHHSITRMDVLLGLVRLATPTEGPPRTVRGLPASVAPRTYHARHPSLARNQPALAAIVIGV